MREKKDYVAKYIRDFDKFLAVCDECDENGLWNGNVEMPVYFFNQVMSFIFRLTIYDRRIDNEICDFLNSHFGLDYSKEEYESLSFDLYNNIVSYYDKDYSNGLDKLKSISEDMVALYKEVLSTVINIILESEYDPGREEVKKADQFILSI